MVVPVGTRVVVGLLYEVYEFQTTIVSGPYKEPGTRAYRGKLRISNIIIELETDTGLVGLAEAVGFPTLRVIAEILNSMQPTVIRPKPIRSQSNRA